MLKSIKRNAVMVIILVGIFAMFSIQLDPNLHKEAVDGVMVAPDSYWLYQILPAPMQSILFKILGGLSGMFLIHILRKNYFSKVDWEVKIIDMTAKHLLIILLYVSMIVSISIGG